MFFVALVLALSMTRASNISMLVSLSLHQPSGPRTRWERGFEILPGALLAVNDINNDSTILCGHKLQLITVDSGRDGIEIVQQFVNLTFHQMHATRIVGVTGILDPKLASILMPLVRHRGVQLSVITHTDQLDIPDYSETFLSLPSPSAIVSVLLNFMKEMNWQRIGLVTDSTDAYFFSVAEIFLQVTKMDDSIIISPYLELFHATSAIQEIAKLNTRIIFVSLNTERAVELICMVYEKGLIWPQYAWIFHSFEVEDLLEQQSDCDKNAVNGAFFIDVQPPSDSTQAKQIIEIISSNYYRQYVSSLPDTSLEYNATFRPNGYTKLLYDSVWAMAIALNKGCHQSTNFTYQKFTTEQRLEDHNWIFKIFHIRKLRQVLISTVHYSNLSIVATSFNATLLENAPRGKLPVITETPPLAYTAVFGLLIALIMVFVTLVLVLYIYFHKEPEIRATSFTLSLLMFAGCYLNLLYLCLLFYNNHTVDSVDISRDNALCLSLLWLSGPGISLPIMLATLLVKMLRIYHIFHNTKLRLSYYCSDLALALYVLLILLPDILIHSIWVFIDRYQIHFEYQAQGVYIHLEKVCTSKYQVQLFGIVTIYLLTLILALAIVAVITRKIRLQHFKDTKKVNILLFILCIGIVVVYSYWLLLQTLDTKRYISNLPLRIGHLVLIISFQSLLFVPKVLPPLWRRQIRKDTSNNDFNSLFNYTLVR